MTDRMLLTIFALIVATTAFAAEKLDAGPNPDTPYVTTAFGTARFESSDKRVVVQQDSIATINCAKCKTPLTLPGMVYHAYNNSAKPVCFVLDMTMAETRAARLVRWGAGEPHYLKPGKWQYRIAGITQSFMNSDSANLGWRGGIRVWEPADGQCGAAPA